MHTPRPTTPTSSRSGFTITELLVVVGIIVLLIGLLLPALGKVIEKSRATETTSAMEEFAKACEAFKQEFGYYPGLVPEEALANPCDAVPLITPIENAILHLSGGAVREDDLPVTIDGVQYDDIFNIKFGEVVDATGSVVDLIGEVLEFDWEDDNGQDQTLKIAFSGQAVGNGPVIAGRQYTPFYTPKGSQFAPVQYSTAPPDTTPGSAAELDLLPTLKDAWGQPIMYVRRIRKQGPLVSYYPGGCDGDKVPGQFEFRSQGKVTQADQLGEFGFGQADSILNVAETTDDGERSLGSQTRTFAQILRNPALGASEQPMTGAARGDYILISAGPDGIFFNQSDGPGSTSDPVTNIVNNSQAEYATPTIVGEYDDLIVAGGG